MSLTLKRSLYYDLYYVPACVILFVLHSMRYFKMSTRSVRLDDEAETALEDIVKRTGMSISDAIKLGLVTYREVAMKTALKRPSDFFNQFDLGDGGYTSGSARDSKSILKNKIKEKVRRRK